jgi:hypothetical protein
MIYSPRTFTPAQYDAYLAAFNVLVERFPDMIGRDVNALAWDLARAIVTDPDMDDDDAACRCGVTGCQARSTARRTPAAEVALMDEIDSTPLEIELTELPADGFDADVHADVPAGRLMEIPAVDVLTGDYVALFGRVVPGGYVLAVTDEAIIARAASLARTGRATIVRPN